MLYTRAAAAQIVPPSGGSLEIGNHTWICEGLILTDSSPFGGIPRNWKRYVFLGNETRLYSSPFGGIPRNWKRT